MQLNFATLPNQEKAFIYQNINASYLEKPIEIKDFKPEDLLTENQIDLVIYNHKLYQDNEAGKEYFYKIEQLKQTLSSRVAFLPSSLFNEKLMSEMTSFNEIEIKKIEHSYQQWLMKIKLSTIEELYTLSLKLKNLWLDDHGQFYDLLWNLIKKLSGAQHVQFLFRDLAELGLVEELKKEKLITYSFQGDYHPSLSPADEIHFKIYQQLSHGCHDMELMSHDIERQQTTLLIQIEESVLLVMLSHAHIDQLFLSLLKSLIRTTQELLAVRKKNKH